MSPKKQSRYLNNQGTSPTFLTLAPDSVRHQIHWIKTGDDSANTVVLFIHGSPGSSSNYLDFLADSSLQRIALLLSVDRPGFGNSRPRGRAIPSLAGQARLIALVLEQYPDKSKILVGHSWGGPLIAQLAIDFPHLVDGLLFVAASVDPELEPSSWYRPILHFLLIRWLLPGWARTSNRELQFSVRELKQLEPYWSQISKPSYIKGYAHNCLGDKLSFFKLVVLRNLP